MLINDASLKGTLFIFCCDGRMEAFLCRATSGKQRKTKGLVRGGENGNLEQEDLHDMLVLLALGSQHLGFWEEGCSQPQAPRRRQLLQALVPLSFILLSPETLSSLPVLQFYVNSGVLRDESALCFTTELRLLDFTAPKLLHDDPEHTS